MPPDAEASPLTTARDGIRRARWPALLAGVGGAATVGLLGAAGLAPLLAGLGAGALATGPVIEWFTSMGMNALAGWVGNLATDGMQAALADDDPDPAWLAALAQRLDAAATSDQALAGELATFLQKLDAVPLALAAIAEEQGAQSELLIDQYRLLQRLSADMDRLQLAGGVLGPVVVAEADRVIAALTAHHDARFDELLTAITALRDAQRQSLINFAGAQMRDVNFQGDVAGRDVNKPTLAAGSTFVQGSVGVMQSIHAHEQSSIGSIIGQQVVHHHATPPPTPRYSIPPAFVRPAIALVGRAPLLDDLRQRLCCGTLRHLALYGKPGVGKSRMALELVADPTLRDHFTGGILVARAGVTENSETTIRAWIDDLGLHDDPRRTVAENLAYISQYIRRDGRPWLVVVDDVWRDSQLRPFLSLPEEVRLLITTRQRDLLLRLGDYLAPEALLELETLAHPDAIALLRATAGLPPDGNEQELDLLAQLVGGLPLILTVMGNYLRLRLLDNPAWFSKALVALRAAATRLNLPLVSLDLVEEQTKQRGWWASLLPFKRKPIQPLSPKAIIELSYATLPQTAQHILLSLAGFPPDPLSFDLASAKIVTERNEREVAEALLLLSQCSLLDGAGAGRWRMHQVLWDWAENYDRRRVTAAQQRLRRWHSDLMNPQYQQEFTAWRSQRDNWAQMLATWHDAQRDPDALALCIHTIVPALIAQAYWNDLLAGLKQALITLNKMASRQAEVALAHYYLGLIHYERAEYAAAEEQTSAAYAAFQAMHSQNGQSGALSLLGMIHKAMGNYPAAQGCYEDALALIPQRDEQNYAACLNNLAALYEEQGNYAAALPLYERALTIREQVLGADHPDTASSLNNLAGLYYAQGNYGAALPLYERALAIREQVLGAEHPDTATSLNNLALLYRAQGNYGAALPLAARALAISERVLGAEHPATATSLNNLAALYQAQGNDGAALPLMLRAVQIFEAKLGPDHPDTQSSRRWLAAIRERMGDAEGT